MFQYEYNNIPKYLFEMAVEAHIPNYLFEMAVEAHIPKYLGSGSITSIGEERANLSAVVYL